MTEQLLIRARVGDQSAFRELTDPFRRELQLHCYRILGSLQDAEDQTQETLLAAWRGLEGFEERASVRAWLYRIATNRCLNALRDRTRRPQEASAMVEPPEPTRLASMLHDLAAESHVLWDKGRDDAPLRFIQGDEPEATRARLALVAATAAVIRSGLAVMGVAPAEEMR